MLAFQIMALHGALQLGLNQNGHRAAAPTSAALHPSVENAACCCGVCPATSFQQPRCQGGPQAGFAEVIFALEAKRTLDLLAGHLADHGVEQTLDFICDFRVRIRTICSLKKRNFFM
ncbi:MAG: hypothetical protein QM741_06755 [Rudaea sp.]